MPHQKNFQWGPFVSFLCFFTLLNVLIAFFILRERAEVPSMPAVFSTLEERLDVLKEKVNVLEKTKELIVAKKGGITQVATIDSLLAGVYDGEMSLEELGKCGDFGIGTFDQLDGEMVLLEGVFYQVKATGQVVRPKLDTKTPFASVLTFPENPTRTEIKEPLDYDALCKKIDALAPNPNVPVAVRLDGHFSNVRTRSVPAQEKPYKPLVEVTKNQPEFELGSLEGTVVGFRLPPYVRGINVPGYHLHFLCSERNRGGHLLQLQMDSGSIAIGLSHRLEVVLPQHVSDFSKADLAIDRSEELEKVEK